MDRKFYLPFIILLNDFKLARHDFTILIEASSMIYIPLNDKLFIISLKLRVFIGNANAQYILKILHDAKQGNAEAQFTLGEMYESGLEISHNDKKAFQWFSTAANNNHAKAQLNLGLRYANGLCVEKNEKMAVSWFIKSANQGNSYAQYHLGRMYFSGSGVTNNKQKAFEWLTKSSEQGHPSAQYHLAKIYGAEDNDFTDLNKALQLYKRAAVQDNAEAQLVLGLMYEGYNAQSLASDSKKTSPYNVNYKDKLKKLYPCGAEVTLDLKQANKWFKKSAIQGNAVAQNILGVKHETKIGSIGLNPTSKTRAFEFYQQAAEKGLIEAQYNLGEMYYQGYALQLASKNEQGYWIDPTINIPQAINFLSKAAEQGLAEAKYSLANIYTGVGLLITEYKDDKKSLELLTQAAEEGLVEAQWSLGDKYLHGHNIKRNNKLAIKWIEKAAEQNFFDAKIALIIMYDLGFGVKENHKQSAYWYTSASEQNYPNFLGLLGSSYESYGTKMYLNTKNLDKYEDDRVFKAYTKAYIFFSMALKNNDRYSSATTVAINNLKKQMPQSIINKAKELFENSSDLDPISQLLI